MILLHRLAADNFKQLQSVELRLPDSGAVLIEGHNEAGKSSLFEAVFFALFGRPLLNERDYAIENLKRYGADTLEVALDFSIAGRAFSITRTYGKAHRAKLLAPTENGEETISSLNEIRKRLSEEMRLSPDALLNTCFVEQKRLERLEDMNREARREAINELLNLKVLSDMENRFKPTRESREEIETQKKRVEIARLDSALPLLEQAVAQAESSVRATRRRGAEELARELETKIEEAQNRQGQIAPQRENIGRELEASTQLAAKVKAIDGELSLRAAAWQNAEKAREQAEAQWRDLQERASTLPPREAKLNEQKQLAQSLIQHGEGESASGEIKSYQSRLVESRARLAEGAGQEKYEARRVRETAAHAPAFYLPLALSVVVLAIGFLTQEPGVLIVSMLVAVVLAVLGIGLVAGQQRQIRAARAAHQKAQQRLASLEGEHRALESQRPAILQNKTDEEIETLLQEYSNHQHSLNEVRQLLVAHDLPVQSSALQTELALLENALQREREVVLQLDAMRREVESQSDLLKASREEFARAWQSICENEGAPDTLPEAAQLLKNMRLELAQKAARLDEENLRERDDALSKEYSALDRQIAAWQHECETQIAIIDSLQSDERNAVERNSEQNLEKSIAEWEAILLARREELIHHRAHRRAAAQTLELGEAVLDLMDEEKQLQQLEASAAVKRRAGEIVSKTRGGIVGRVMPLTIANVRRVLPLLTEGRYRDVQWDEENNVLAVYDFLARDFVRKRVFSGGARDQISLALRLAFALATLPGEHNIRPGFLFLDEPLSSFDRTRTQALVELLTRGLIRQSFQQIFLVSHSQSFDPALFDYRLRMESGRVAESTLP